MVPYNKLPFRKQEWQQNNPVFQNLVSLMIEGHVWDGVHWFSMTGGRGVLCLHGSVFNFKFYTECTVCDPVVKWAKNMMQVNLQTRRMRWRFIMR